VWAWLVACDGMTKLQGGTDTDTGARAPWVGTTETDLDTQVTADTDVDTADSGSTGTTPVFTDCRYPTWEVPPVALTGWTDALSRTGVDTLTWDPAHSHDDGLGAIGYCPAGVLPGERYLALVSARFETDQTPPYAPCPVDPAAADPELATYGMCSSGGKHNVYVEVQDASGARVVAGFEVSWEGGYSYVGDQGKPATEFPMNFPMFGGGRYGVEADWQGLESDWVSNLRLPGNHHVDYLLTFRETTR
jgi:hypothetical protein